MDIFVCVNLDAYKTPNQGIVVTVKTASITKLKVR